MKKDNFDLIFEQIDYNTYKKKNDNFSKTESLSILEKKRGIDELIEDFEYSETKLKDDELDKGYKDYYSKIRKGEFEEKCIGLVDSVETVLKYKVSDIRNLLKNSKEFADIFAEVKNRIRNDGIVDDIENESLLKDLKHNHARYTQVYKKIYDLIPFKKIDEILKIKIRYKNEFYDKFTNYIIEDYFDYGLLGNLMGENADKLVEIPQNDFISNLDIRDGWITYTTAFNRERKIFNIEKLSPEEVEILVNKLLRKGEALSASSTSVNGIVPGLNYRIAVKHKSKTSSETHVVSIRRQKQNLDMQYYLDTNFINDEIYRFLEKVIKQAKNIIFSGATGTGKTTLINAIKQEFINEKESLIVLEDTPEIYIKGKSEVAFYSDNKKGSTDIDNFVDTLRHQPDRIIVGEIRKPGPAKMLVQAANTGLSKGIMTTIHANSARDALRRLSDIIKEGDNKIENELVLSNKIRKSIDYVLQLGLENTKFENTVKTRFVIKEVSKVIKEDPFLIIQDNIENSKKEIEKIYSILERENISNTEKEILNSKINLLNSEILLWEIEIKYSPVKLNQLLKWENGCYTINKLKEELKDYDL